MRSVSQLEPDYKPIRAYETGTNVPMRVIGNPTGKGGGKRRAITAFTKEARARMRRALLEHTIPHSITVGLTLTVPWSNEWIAANEQAANDEFRECFNRFGVTWRRTMPNCAAIFRVELQKRKAPHIHAVCWIPIPQAASAPAGAPVVPTDAQAAAQWFFGYAASAWFTAVRDMHGGSLGGFARRGVKVEPIPDMGAMLRYLCDHATKAKQAQLGYKGKQWGYINRKVLTKARGEVLDFEDTPEGEYARAMFLRALRRYTAYHRAVPCVFGYKTLANHRKSGVYYTPSAPVRRLYEWAISLNRGSAMMSD